LTHSPSKPEQNCTGKGGLGTRGIPHRFNEIAGVTDCLIFVYGLQRKNDLQHNWSAEAKTIGGRNKSSTPHCPDVY
jgi:hypothetical protein